MSLSTAHFEHGLSILGELDGPAVSEALAKLGPVVASGEAVPLSALLGMALPFLRAAGSAGRGRLLRRLSAVVRASVDELMEAEGDPKKMAALERAAAVRPYGETLQDALDFFSEFGLSMPPTPGFLGMGEGPEVTAPPEGSPSGD